MCVRVCVCLCETWDKGREIERIVHDAAIERDAYPSPLNYLGFPKSVCTSVNEVCMTFARARVCLCCGKRGPVHTDLCTI